MTDRTEAQNAARALAAWFTALATATDVHRRLDGWSASVEQRDLPRWQERATALGGKVTYELWVGESGTAYASLRVDGVPDLAARALVSAPLDEPAAERVLAEHPGAQDYEVTVPAAEWLAVVLTGMRKRARR